MSGKCVMAGRVTADYFLIGQSRRARVLFEVIVRERPAEGNPLSQEERVSTSIADENNIELISPIMRPALQEFAALIQKLTGPRLNGLTAFGQVLSKDFDLAHLAARSVLVLDGIDLGLLRRISEHGPQFGAKHIAAPLVMTPGYITASLDTFPLEFAEIIQRRATLAGQDYFADLHVETEHLRLQCERELKQILIRLRQAVLSAGTHEGLLGDLQLDIGRQLLRTLRGVSWIHGKKDYAPSEQVLGETEQWLGCRLEGARSVILSHGGLGWPEFQTFYHDVEKLAEKADAL